MGRDLMAEVWEMATGIRRFIRFSLILCVLALVCAPAWCATIYVKTDGLDTNDGSSWELAKKTVQAGIDAAVSGDEVWVAQGTYVERITLKEGMKLYGGYSGVGTTRDIAAYVTTIEDNQGWSVVTSPSGATTATVIDGFTIRNGYSGICCENSSPTIANNTITENSAYYGGGIYCYYSSPTITNNTITENSASHGGGIYCENSSPTITNNMITGNGGSGIQCSGG